jgi:very-short-patch-repair endonuclease
VANATLGQHLDNPEAYRRDRRKDVLPQENGFHVLKFLREDVGKRFDEVLDVIIRALSHRAQQQHDKEQPEWNNSIELRRTLLG